MTERLVWSDEFDRLIGPTPDPGVWVSEVGGGGWGDDQLQTYTAPPANAFITPDGQLAPTVPIYVTENGIATADDNRRIAYLDGALAAVQDCLDDRIDLGGYFHFCALDGYEWGSYTPKFGLVGWDPVTFQRHPKPSLSWYGQYAASAATASTNDTSSPACTRRGAGRRTRRSPTVNPEETDRHQH